MGYIRIVHDYPNCSDSTVGPYQSKEEADANLAKNGWEINNGVYTKIHPKQGWEMKAFFKEFDDLKRFNSKH